MPRTARASVGDVCYHVLNRGNARAPVFHKAADYDAFLSLIADACERLPMRVLGYCLMPNHFHLVLRPHDDGDLSRWMQWLLTSHVRRYHKHHRTPGGGHVWQGRFKAFPIELDEHLQAVLRYVERNPLRANLVKHAEDWRWSSLRHRLPATRGATPGAAPGTAPGAATGAAPGAAPGSSTGTAPGPTPARLAPLPIDLPRKWRWRVNQAESDAELAALRRSVQRGTPFGGERWTAKTAAAMGLESTLRPRGRPRKEAKK